MPKREIVYVYLKPLTISACLQLSESRHRTVDVLMQKAFIYRFHENWWTLSKQLSQDAPSSSACRCQ